MEKLTGWYFSCPSIWLSPYKPREIFQILNGHNFKISRYINIKEHDAKFFRSVISSISLIFELAGSNLLQIMLNPPHDLWHSLFLLGGSIVFANKEKGSFSIESFPYNHNTTDEI